MESEAHRTLARHKQEEENWRRRCGCIRTSDKLKQIINCFPPPPPPTPEHSKGPSAHGNSCISAYCTRVHTSNLQPPALNKVIKPPMETQEELESEKPCKKARTWHVITELVQLVQISVTATALALYYLIYCYMQLIYYTLRSALYFHNADGAMKVTIAVVTITSLVIAFNLILRIEKLIWVL